MNKETTVKKWPFIVGLTIAFVAYFIIRALRPDPPNTNPLNLSSKAIVFLSATILVPYFLTWIVSTVSWYRFKLLVKIGQKNYWAYTSGFNRIGQGVGLLVLDLIGVAILGAVRSNYIYEYKTAMVLTIIYNLFHVIIPLVAFICIYLGSKELASKGHYATKIKQRNVAVLLPVVTLLFLFCVLVFTSSVRQFPPGRGELATYYLPDFFIAILIILPLAATWFMGLRSALNIEQFTHSLGSMEMREAITRFYNGLLAVIGSAIILQALFALGGTRLIQLGRLNLLLLFYFWLIMQAAAFYWLSSSAKNVIKNIELEANRK